jgi:hypothetical protein
MSSDPFFGFFNSGPWEWLGRISKSLNDGKFVVRKIGPQWYIVFATIEPVPVDSQAAGVEIGNSVVRFMQSLGFTDA